MQVPQFVIGVVVFAILFPLLSWLFNRKSFSWLGSLIAIVIFAALMAVFQYTDLASHLTIPKF